MARSVIVGVGPVRSAAIRRLAPRKILRGEVRTMVREVLRRLNSVSNADDREYKRSLELGYEAFLIMGMNNSTNGRAFKHVMDRLKECMDALEGDS